MDDKNKTFLPDNCQNPRGKTTKERKKNLQFWLYKGYIANPGNLKSISPLKKA